MMNVIVPDRLRAEMQMELFKPMLNLPTSGDLAILAQEIRRDGIFDPFRIQVVGSMVTRPMRARDIDILFLRRNARSLKLLEVENALLSARRIGIHQLGISVDPFYINSSEDTFGGELSPETVMVEWKLEDYVQGIRIEIGLIKRFRRVGHHMLVLHRRAADCRFYDKLPIVQTLTNGTCRALAFGEPLEKYL